MRFALKYALLLWLAGLFCFTANAQSTLKVLSWNIYMLPNLAKKTGQEKRASAIVDVLLNSDYDVIVFQEVFHKKAYQILLDSLKTTYPYNSGEPANKGFTLTSSGIWILSKHPLALKEHISFTKCEGTDCFANKGATLVEVTKGGQNFQFIGTHLQADTGRSKDLVRQSQLIEIKLLMNRYKNNNTPQFIVGDFNIPQADATNYSLMQTTLQAEDGPLSGNMVYSWDAKINELTKDKYTWQGLLDYILVAPNSFTFTNETRMITRKMMRWSCTEQDLSDHFAVEAVFEY